MMRHLLRTMVLGGAIVGCTPPPPPTQSPPVVTGKSYELESATPGAEAGTAASDVWACRLSVTESIGCRGSQIEALVAPVRRRMEACRGGRGGKLQIRVRNAGGKLAFDVEPGSSLDPREQQCVRDALATIHDGTASNVSTGANVPPTNFTALITVEW